MYYISDRLSLHIYIISDSYYICWLLLNEARPETHSFCTLRDENEWPAYFEHPFFNSIILYSHPQINYFADLHR